MSDYILFCVFGAEIHAAEAIVVHDEDEFPACEKHLADVIHWRFVNGASEIRVRRIQNAPVKA